MSLIEELKEAGLFEEGDIVESDEELTVFERIDKDIREGELGKRLRSIRENEAIAWARMGSQVIGSEDI